MRRLCFCVRFVVAEKEPMFDDAPSPVDIPETKSIRSMGSMLLLTPGQGSVIDNVLHER